MIVAAMAVGKIVEPILILTGVGVRTLGLTQNPERTGRAKIAVTLKPVINRRGVLAAAEAARAASAMETDKPSRIRPSAQRIPRATVRETLRLRRQVPLLARTPETKRRTQPDKTSLITSDLGGAHE